MHHLQKIRANWQFRQKRARVEDRGRGGWATSRRGAGHELQRDHAAVREAAWTLWSCGNRPPQRLMIFSNLPHPPVVVVRLMRLVV